MPTRRIPAGPRHDAAALRLAQIAASVPTAAPGPADDVTSDDWWADHTRIAPALRAEIATASPAPAATGAPALPVPGRHAARRSLLPGRGDLGRFAGALPALASAHVAVVALALALGLAVTTWWVVRDDPGPATTPLVAASVSPLVGDLGGAGPGPSGSAGAGSEAAGSARAGSAGAGSAGAEPTGSGTSLASGPGATDSVTVDVAGKVRRPGIVVLHQGARVTDALHAAGGPRRGVDLSSLNLARVLVDGEQIVVGARATAAPADGTAPPAGAPPGATGSLVNLNRAGQSELESLPQVGPVTAQAIIAWREQRGGFTSIEELLEVDGIGPKTLERLAPHVTL